VHESVSEPGSRGRGIALPAVVVGVLTGFGAGYLMAYLTDVVATPPMFVWSLAILLFPYAVLVAVGLIMWVRKPLESRDRRMFMVAYWTSFALLYVTTMILYWLTRV